MSQDSQTPNILPSSTKNSAPRGTQTQGSNESKAWEFHALTICTPVLSADLFFFRN